MAAKLARPEAKVVLVSGDGSFGFNAIEFETAARHGIPVVAVVCNDQAWGSAKHSQELCYAHGPGMRDRAGRGALRAAWSSPWAATASWSPGTKRSSPAIERALHSGKPACVNVLTDPTVTSPSTLIYAESIKGW